MEGIERCFPGGIGLVLRNTLGVPDNRGGESEGGREIIDKVQADGLGGGTLHAAEGALNVIGKLERHGYEDDGHDEPKDEAQDSMAAGVVPFDGQIDRQ